MKKFMSILLCTMLLVSIMTGLATAGNSPQIPISSIESSICQDSVTDFTNSIESRAQMGRINALAWKYYNYYVQQGYIKNGALTVDVETLKAVHLDENGQLVDSEIRSVAPGQAVSVLSQMGVYMTESGVAQECAILGGLAAIDGPIPVGDFLALCVGVYFICDHISNYVNHETAMRSEINGSVSSTCASNASQSISQANTVRRNTNYNYFEAARCWEPGGGVYIGAGISEAQAVARLSAGYDVWSRTASRAATVARQASPSFTATYHSPHQLNEYPLNLSHYHPDGMGSNPPHSFYGGNYH